MEMALFNNRPAPRETGVCGAGRKCPRMRSRSTFARIYCCGPRRFDQLQSCEISSVSR